MSKVKNSISLILFIILGMVFLSSCKLFSRPDYAATMQVNVAETLALIPSQTALPTFTTRPTYTKLPTLTALPTYTKLPTLTALPTHTKLPTYTALPTYTKLPTYTALPTYTKLPTLTALPTYTKLPTLTALPTYTKLPTLTALPTYTKLPTNTPYATSTARPTYTVYPTYTAQASATARIEYRYATATPNQNFLMQDKVDGFYLVGSEISTGIWRTESDHSKCYWKLTDIQGSIIQNYIGAGGGTITITADAWQLEIQGCGSVRFVQIETK